MPLHVDIFPGVDIKIQSTDHIVTVVFECEDFDAVKATAQTFATRYQHAFLGFSAVRTESKRTVTVTLQRAVLEEA